jgi:hypothetical protein
MTTTNENIKLENEVFAAYISKGESIYGFQFTPDAIINHLKAKSIEYAISTEPPTAKIAKLLKKYHGVFMIKDGNTPRITVFIKAEVV